MLSMNGQLPDRLIILPRTPSFTDLQTEQAGLLSPRLRSFSGRSISLTTVSPTSYIDALQSSRCDDPLLTWRTASQSGGDALSGMGSPPSSPGQAIVSPTHEASGLRTLFKGRKSLVSGSAESSIVAGGGSGSWDPSLGEIPGADEDPSSCARDTGGSSGRGEPDLLSGLTRRNSYSVAQMATMRNGSQQPNGRLSAAGGEHQYRNPPSLLGGSPRSSGAGTEVLGRSSSFFGAGTGSSSGQGGSLLVGLGRSHTLASSSRDGTAVFGDASGGVGDDGDGMRRQSSLTGRQQSFTGMVRPTWRGGAVPGGDHLQSQTHEALQRLMMSSSSVGGASRASSEGAGGGGSLSVCAGSGGSFTSGSGSGGNGRGSSGVSLSGVSAAGGVGVGNGVGSGPQRKFSAKGVLGSVVDKGLGLFRSGGLGTTERGLASTRGQGKLDERVGAVGGRSGAGSPEGVVGDRDSAISSDGDGRDPEAGEVVVADESY